MHCITALAIPDIVTALSVELGNISLATYTFIFLIYVSNFFNFRAALADQGTALRGRDDQTEAQKESVLQLRKNQTSSFVVIKGLINSFYLTVCSTSKKQSHQEAVRTSSENLNNKREKIVHLRFSYILKFMAYHRKRFRNCFQISRNCDYPFGTRAVRNVNFGAALWKKSNFCKKKKHCEICVAHIPRP
uniref:Uncharacterized protein n=1 Tax=Romanomermis culicivorax TaxID=13658 RepID=A0A915KHG0_ROMCU